MNSDAKMLFQALQESAAMISQVVSGLSTQSQIILGITVIAIVIIVMIMLLRILFGSRRILKKMRIESAEILKASMTTMQGMHRESLNHTRDEIQGFKKNLQKVVDTKGSSELQSVLAYLEDKDLSTLSDNALHLKMSSENLFSAFKKIEKLPEDLDTSKIRTILNSSIVSDSEELVEKSQIIIDAATLAEKIRAMPKRSDLPELGDYITNDELKMLRKIANIPTEEMERFVETITVLSELDGIEYAAKNIKHLSLEPEQIDAVIKLLDLGKRISP